MLLSGNFSLFNFFNFYDFFFKYYWDFRYNFNFWISTFSFKKLNIILKYFVKKNILKFNKSNKNKIFNTNKNSISFFKVAANCYNYLFLEKTKLFYLKNNFRSFIKKYKKSFCLRLRKLRFFTYLNKSFYGFNFFFKINKWYLDFTNEFNYEFIFVDVCIYYLCELFLKILLKFNLINSTLTSNSTVNNVFYYDFYYKYKQLFFFLGNQLIDTNSAILNSFNFSLFLYNKNYNWFFFNYFWKWYFINIIFKNNIIYSLPKINLYNNFLSDNFIFAKDNNSIVNFFFKFNINTTFKFNRMSLLVKYILSKNLLLFDQYFWYNIFYTKIKKI